jgi:hypothetical protein
MRQPSKQAFSRTKKDDEHKGLPYAAGATWANAGRPFLAFWHHLSLGVELRQCRFSLNLPLFGLGPSSKGLGTDLKLSTNKIA